MRIETFKQHNINDDIKEKILNATDWSDFTEAIILKYGKTVPLFHATTVENSKIIDKEGLKLTKGKNYKSFQEEDILYFQIGKSDYISENRPILYKLEVTIDFINNCDVDNDNVDVDEETLSKYINLDEFESMDSDIKDVIEYFIWNKFKIEGFELILHNRYTKEGEDIFKNTKIEKVKEQ
jgi:hypothetical protein